MQMKQGYLKYCQIIAELEKLNPGVKFVVTQHTSFTNRMCITNANNERAITLVINDYSLSVDYFVSGEVLIEPVLCPLTAAARVTAFLNGEVDSLHPSAFAN